MKTKKLLISILMAGFALNFVCGASAQGQNGASEKLDLLADSAHVKALGRTYFDDDVLWMNFSSSGAEFEIDADFFELTIVGDSSTPMAQDNGAAARLAVFFNGDRILDEMILEREQIFTFTDDEGPIKGLVQVIKISEGSSSSLGLKKITVDAKGSVKPATDRKLKIEFVGDSITCGYGVDDPVKEHHFKTATEDNTKTYAYKTAQNLDADYSMVSCSGWGIVSGYSGDGKKQTWGLIPTIYDKVGVSGNTVNGKNLRNIDWDFDKFQPDFVVINLGTNDASYTKGNSKKIDEYKSTYIDFLKKVRKYNPNAKIICSLGIMGQDLYPAIESLVKTYIAQTGDSEVYTLKFNTQNMSADGIAADWHPSEKTHAKAAALLTKKIESLIEK